MKAFFVGARNAVLVLSVFVMLLVFAHHSAGRSGEEKFADYCLSKSGEAFAAFLGLITGHAVASVSKDNGNGNGRLGIVTVTADSTGADAVSVEKKDLT